MELKRLHIGTMLYGIESMEHLKSELFLAFANTQDITRNKRVRDSQVDYD